MSFLNVNFGVISFEDQSITNPQIRTLDVTRSLLGNTIHSERTDRVEKLAPGESQVVAVTARALTQDNTTQYQILHPWAADQANVRLQWTGVGTAPGFATKRNLGIDATTVITITRINPATIRVQSVGGTPLSSAAVLVGDWVKFERSTDAFASAFVLQGVFRVLSTGSGTIDLLDNGAMSTDTAVLLGSDFDKQIRTFSQGSVKIGDTIEISGQNPNNNGKMLVSDLAFDYVTFTNAFAVDETFTNSVGAVQIYDRLIGFVYVRSNGPVGMKVNDGNAIQITKLGQHEGFFMGCVEAYKIEMVNLGTEIVSATVFHASLC